MTSRRQRWLVSGAYLAAALIAGALVGLISTNDGYTQPETALGSMPDCRLATGELRADSESPYPRQICPFESSKRARRHPQESLG